MNNRLFAFGLAALVACGSYGGDGMDDTDDMGEEPELTPDSTFMVSGTVNDLATGEPIAGTATIVVDGLEPAPSVSTSGAEFSIEVPANSTFNLLAGSPPDYRNTYNAAVEVKAEDVEGLQLFAISEAHLGELIGAFGVEPEPSTGVIILQTVDQDGNVLAGVPATAFVAPPEMSGPFFLDAAYAADPALESTSESGIAMFFDADPGLTQFALAQDGGYQVAVPDSPVASNTASYVRALVTEGEDIVVPVNVSFEQDVAPIFSERGCTACHDGGGVGKDLAGLHLNGQTQKMYKEVAEEPSVLYDVPRIDLAAPENSLILTMPSVEDPPDAHPYSTFTGKSDPDYQTLKVWIEEGGQLN